MRRDTQKKEMPRREFIGWLCRISAGCSVVTAGVGVSPLTKINTTLFSEASAQPLGPCTEDTCTLQDVCESGDAGHTCSQKDVCDADLSKDCTDDICTADSSNECSDDNCVSDKSGDCGGDQCVADSSDVCRGDTCETDSSKYCEIDECQSDSSGDCWGDVCETDSSKGCQGDECVSDSSGECGQDYCIKDSSGNCDNDDCISDKSGDCTGDQCESDSSGECETDYCSSDSSGYCESDDCRSDSSGECWDDACESDSAQGCRGDACVVDSSGECEIDNCVADSAGGCDTDNCVSDSSGGCSVDRCNSDSSGACQTDTCRSDSSGYCENDNCLSDSSGECGGDICESDSSSGCENDKCVADSSGECKNDLCTADASGACSQRDVCILDFSNNCGSDLCREDRTPIDIECGVDTCPLDLSMNDPINRRQLARAGVNRALKLLYNIGKVALFLCVFCWGQARAETAVDARDAVFSKAPIYVTSGSVAVDDPVGPFIRDCDGDGILEADVDGNGDCSGDPELQDYNGDGSLELPENTDFLGEFDFSCFYIPDDVAIVATGPLTVRASQEMAVFGAVRLPEGGDFAATSKIDLRTSSWLSEEDLIFTTSLAGEVDESLTLEFDPEEPTVPPVEFESICWNDEPEYTFYRDADGDGYGDLENTLQAPEAPDGYVADNTDCDDTNPAIHPGAAEVCDGVDNDCDGQIDEGVTSLFYSDSDGDGYGDSAETTQACSAPEGYVVDNTDCDDTRIDVHPGSQEICDGLDNDCNGQTDEEGCNIFYRDADGDGYGDSGNSAEASEAPDGYVADSTDCDDTNPDIHPGADEVCDGVDNDCDERIDEGCEPCSVAGDLDGDCDVDFSDREVLYGAMRSCDGGTNFVDGADYDGDGCITLGDYRIWYGYYKAVSK